MAFNVVPVAVREHWYNDIITASQYLEWDALCPNHRAVKSARQLYISVTDEIKINEHNKPI